MLNERKHLKIKIPSEKFKKLNALSLANIKNRNLRIAVQLLLIVAFITLLVVGLNKWYVQASNLEINNLVKDYIQTMNRQDFKQLGQYLIPVDKEANQDYILTLKAKAEAIQLKSVRAKTIYPALVDKDIALVCVEVSTEGGYKSQYMTVKELNIMVLKKYQDKWYVAKPSDLMEYDEAYLSGLFDKYQDYLKDQIPSFNDRSYYNSIAYQKLEEAKGKK